MTKRPILSLKKIPASFQKKIDEEAAKRRKEAHKAQLEMTPRQKAVSAVTRNYSVLTWLAETYPPLFQVTDPKPLKIGFFKELIEALNSLETVPFSRLSIRKALSFYTRGPKYQEAIIQGDDRYNLTGEAVEPITDEQKAYAQEILTRYKEKRAEQKKAKKAIKKKFNKKKPGKKKDTVQAQAEPEPEASVGGL